jgi:hypothetical protein
LPSEEPFAVEVLTTRTQADIFECGVAAWNPDWGIVTSHAFRKLLPAHEFGLPRVGWITYLPSAVSGPLPEPVRVIELSSNGILIACSDKPLVSWDQEHVKLAQQLEAILP